jgi:hypothetical protein
MEPQKTPITLQMEDPPNQTNQPGGKHRTRISHKDQEEEHGDLQRSPLRAKNKEEDPKGVEQRVRSK